jgi:hypothetical protein
VSPSTGSLKAELIGDVRNGCDALWLALSLLLASKSAADAADETTRAAIPTVSAALKSLCGKKYYPDDFLCADRNTITRLLEISLRLTSS